MFLNFLMVMPEPWKGSVSEVYQIRSTDGTDERIAPRFFPVAKVASIHARTNYCVFVSTAVKSGK